MSSNKGVVAQEIEKRLQEALNPEVLKVIDESDQHIGHAGYREGGESHFKVVIKACALNEYSRINKHQKIYEILDDLMKEKIHALSIDC